MTSAVNTRHSDIGGRSSSLKFRISKQHPTPQCVEPMEDLSPSKNRSLPGRLTRSAAAIASNRSLRIDTEQLRSLSIRDTKPPRRRTGSQHPASDIREQQFQKYRELLWTNGRDNLGNKDTPHYKIAPVRLPAASSPSSSYDIITIYTVVHSEGHSPVGLRRQFDRSLLHATVPEPFQSPATPNFDREELLSAIVDTNKSLASRKFRMSKRSSAAKRDPRMRTGSPSPIPAGVPMHFQYARAHLPVLASIMMSKQVRFGDTIELPLPHPEVWAETVAWVYTGEEALATPKVQKNIEYLGGRVC